MGQRIVEEDSTLVELRGNEVQGDFRGQGEEREVILKTVTIGHHVPMSINTNLGGISQITVYLNYASEVVHCSANSEYGVFDYLLIPEQKRLHSIFR